MAYYPNYRISLYTTFVAMQRVWFRCQPAISFVIRVTPRLMQLVVFRALAKLFRMESVTATGNLGKIVGSPMDVGMFGEYLSTGNFSPKTLNHMLEFFAQRESTGTFIDVGGHIGLMSIPVARSGAINCIVFEPEPLNHKFLLENISNAKLENQVDVKNLALFDKAGSLDFEVAEWHHGDHRIRNTEEVSDRSFDYAPFREDTRPIVTVETQKLDDAVSLSTVSTPLVVKIDTQGSEAHVFSGGNKVLKAADLLVTEFCPYMITRMGGDTETVLTFLEQHFNKGFVSGKHNKNVPIEYVEISEVTDYLRNFVRRANLDFVDIIVTK